MTDKLIVTIAIQMHGSVISYNLSSKVTDIFENVRLLCQAGGLKEYTVGKRGMPGILEEFMLVGNLRKIFQRDIDSSTYDIIRGSERGILIGNVTIDKELSTIGTSEMLDYLTGSVFLRGVYLLSIHREQNLIYPVNPDEKAINLLNISDLHRLASFFGTTVPNLEDISIPFPDQSIYINQIDIVKRNLDIPADEKERKIKDIKKEFMNLLDEWNLTLGSRGIKQIKLSYLVKLIKTILGQNIIINLLDYSCSAPSEFISDDTRSNAKFFMEDDIEQGIPHKGYGGKKKKKRTLRKKLKRSRLSKRFKRFKRFTR